MALRTRRSQPAKKQEEVQKKGLFTGTAQAGPARQKRAHALAEELLARGCLFIQNQVWDEAAREFRKAIKMEPDYAEAYNNLGLCLLYALKPDEALEAFQTALEHFPGWSIAEANMGLALQRMQHPEEAIKYYDISLKKKTNQPAVWLALGDAYAAIGKVDKALESYHTAIQQAPGYDLAHYRVGMIQARRNKLDEAEAALNRALEIEPDNVEATAVLGAIAARRGNINHARELFGQVEGAEKIPTPALKGMNRLSVFGTGLQTAFEEWQTQMPPAGELAECYYNLGLSHLVAGNQAEAKDAFRQATELQPTWPEPLIWFGFFAALDGDALTARKNWEAAFKLKPDNGMLREQLGYLAIAMGLQKEAEAHFTEAIRLGREIPAEHIQPDAHISK